jgi:hypothetical protein
VICQSKRRRLNMFKKIIFFIVTIWLVLYNNSLMYPSNLGYSWSHLPIPKFFRFIEIIVITTIYFFSLKKYANDRSMGQTKLLTLTLLLLSFIGILVSFNFSYSYYQFISIYLLLSPLWLYDVFCSIGIDENFIKKVVKFYFCYILLNLLTVLLVHIPKYWQVHPDNVNGFFSDAHVFGSFMAMGSVAFFSKFIYERKTKFLGISILFLLISFFSSNEKVIIANLLFLFFLLFTYSKITRLVTYVIAGSILFLVFSNFDVETFLEPLGIEFRLFWLIKAIDFSELGPIKAWQISMHYWLANPYTFLFGTGPANYASVGALAAFTEGVKNLIYQQNDFYISMSELAFNSSFDRPFNFFTNILVEFGLLGFLLFFILVFKIIKTVYKQKHLTGLNKILRIVFLFNMFVFFFTGMIMPGEWMTQILSYPTMLLGAYFFCLKRNDLVTNGGEKS